MTQTLSPPTTAMRMTAKRDELAAILATASRVIKSRTPKPVLLCVRMIADDNRLTIDATNLETAVRMSTAQIQLEHAGAVLVPADRLLATVRVMTDDIITLEEKGDCLHVSGSSSHHKIFTQKVSDFPPFIRPDENKGGEISGEDLLRALRQASSTIANCETRYAFNGVKIEAKKQTITFVGTDGRMLTRVDAPWQGSPIDALMSGDAVPTVLAAIAEAESVRVWQTENQVGFKGDDFEVVNAQIQGSFPPYDDIIPKESDTSVTLSTPDLIGALEQVIVPLNEESKGARFVFNKSGLRITARSPERGEAEITLPCKVDGRDIEIGFNPSFILKGLKSLGADEVKFGMTSPSRPGCFTAPRFTLVVMPVNLQ